MRDTWEPTEEQLANFYDRAQDFADGETPLESVGDPNADLVGYTFRREDGRDWTVTGTAGWSSQYVNLEATGALSCASASLVRNHRRMKEEEEES